MGASPSSGSTWSREMRCSSRQSSKSEPIVMSSSAPILRGGDGVLHHSGLGEHGEDAQEVAGDDGVQRGRASAVLRPDGRPRPASGLAHSFAMEAMMSAARRR